MSLILINMEKLTPLNNKGKKSGMTLIEIMASLAILSILFSAISSLIMNNLKFEEKSNIKIDNYTFVKTITDLFETNTGGIIKESGGEGFEYYISDEVFKSNYKNKNIYINFNDSEEMRELLKSGMVMEYVSDSEIHESESLYELRLKIKAVKSNHKEVQVSSLYNIDVKLIDKVNNDDINKNLYITRVEVREIEGDK